MSSNLEAKVEGVSGGAIRNSSYNLFSEQYLEKPEKYELGTGPTICTIKKIPCFDDW